MKTKHEVKYTDEPKEDGWGYTGSSPLTREEILAAGLPLPGSSRGGEYERVEQGGLVRLIPKKRGGARPGAGRKPKHQLRMQVFVSEKARNKIEAMAKRHKLTLSGAIERAVMAVH